MLEVSNISVSDYDSMTILCKYVVAACGSETRMSCSFLGLTDPVVGQVLEQVESELAFLTS